MNKELPKVYAVPIEKDLQNNKNTFISTEKEVRSAVGITKTDINKIFNAKSHVYKSRIRLTTKEGQREVEVVGLYNDSLLTLNGEKIPINSILAIEKV